MNLGALSLLSAQFDSLQNLSLQWLPVYKSINVQGKKLSSLSIHSLTVHFQHVLSIFGAERMLTISRSRGCSSHSQGLGPAVLYRVVHQMVDYLDFILVHLILVAYLCDQVCIATFQENESCKELRKRE